MKAVSSRRFLRLGLIVALGFVSAGLAGAASNDKRALGDFDGTYKGVWKAAGNLPLTLTMPKGKGGGAGTFEATPCDPGDDVSPLKIRITKVKVRRNGKKLISTGKATWERADVPSLIGGNLKGNLKIVATLRGNKAAARGQMQTGKLSGRLNVKQGGSLPNATCVERTFSLNTVPIRVTDNNTTVVTLKVPNSVGVISDLDVSVSIAPLPMLNLFNTDYDVVLRHVPSGVEIELFTDIGFDDDGIFVRLDDDAATDIGDVPDDPNDFPINGTFKTEDTSGDPMPAEFLLSTFNGVLASGTWQLVITDDSGGLVGDLQNWTLHITQ